VWQACSALQAKALLEVALTLNRALSFDLWLALALLALALLTLILQFWPLQA